jgi:hypothetical protein
MMRRSATVFLLGLAVVAACSEVPDVDLGPSASYSIEAVQPTASVRQDDTLRLATTVLRDNSVTVVGARILWAVDDDRIASVSSTGLVTAKAPGTTTVRASFSGDTATIALTVTPRTATSVSLTVNHSGSHFGTGYGLPSRPDAVWLKAVIMSGSDIVYCNTGIACAPSTRVQRLVEFVSLSPTEATISNAQGTTIAAGTAGQVTALDTTGSRQIGFVLRSPGDSGVAARWADTAWVNFIVRPIDSIIAKPGTFTVLGANNAVITVNYGNNIARDSAMVLVVDQISRRDSISTLQTTALPGGRTQANVVITRTVPRVTWETVNSTYAVVEASGRVTGLRNFWLAGDAPATGTDCRPEPARVTGFDVTYVYDRVLTNFQIPDSVSTATGKAAAPWLVPTGCAQGNAGATPPVPPSGPVNVARGVHCTHATAHPLATCTVLIRATITDPDGPTADANGDGLADNVKRFIYPLVIRAP